MSCDCVSKWHGPCSSTKAMKTYFRLRRFYCSVLILFIAATGPSAFASTPPNCSWIFSPQKMILNIDREVKENPHSAYVIGLQIQEKNLRRLIEEISGERKLDQVGCLDGRCKAADKVRFRHWLVKKVKSYGADSYFEWERNESLSGLKLNGNPDKGPLSFKHASAAFAKNLLNAKSLNSFFTFLRYAKFEFNIENFKSIDADFIEDLINGLTSPDSQGPVGESFELTWARVRKSPFVTNQLLSERLLGELQNLKERLYAGEIAKNLARGSDSKLLVIPEVINVVTEIAGSKFPNEIIEVSAHYDTVPRAPGADDNGSGISTMIEMIRIFKIFPPQRTIRFVFTDLEESGKYGSILHAKSVLKNNDNLVAALVIDTIGYHPTRHNNSLPVYVLELGTRKMHMNNYSYQQSRAFAEALAWQSNRYHRQVRYSVETKGALPSTGDHGSYLEAGLPAIFAAAGFEGDLVNPGYHRSSDTISNYNWPFFMNIARVLTEGVAIVSGSRVSDQDYKSISKENMSILDAAVDSNASQRTLLRTIPGKGIPKPTPQEAESGGDFLSQMLKLFGF